MFSERPPGTQPSMWSRGAGGTVAALGDLVSSEANPDLRHPALRLVVG
jgi:hypothetical protein